jgi:hypothetical protein
MVQNFEAFHYVILCILFLHFSYDHVLTLAPCSQTRGSVGPLWRDIWPI